MRKTSPHVFHSEGEHQTEYRVLPGLSALHCSSALGGLSDLWWSTMGLIDLSGVRLWFRRKTDDLTSSSTGRTGWRPDW